jgi:hypothetical protein
MYNAYPAGYALYIERYASNFQTGLGSSWLTTQ